MPMYDAKINPQPPTRTEQTQPQSHSLRTIDGGNSRYSFADGFARRLFLKVAQGQNPRATTTCGGTAIVAMPIYCA